MHNRNVLLLAVWSHFLCAANAPAFAATMLDPGFGLKGRVAVELGVKNSGHAALVQPDGKIVVAGSSSMGNALNFSLLRFNPDGTPDASFNGDGSVITSLSTRDDEALALGLLPDGRIVAAGYSHNGKDRDLAMICYRRDGTLDRNFGDAGVVLISIGNGNEEISALTINASGMITVAGTTEGTAGRILVVARYDAKGEPDFTFGEQGISLIGVGEDASAEGIVEREDGTYVISGSYMDRKKSSALLVGLQADGTVDAGFGEKGVAIPSADIAASEGFGVAADDAGKIYVAGSVGLPGKRESALFRFTGQGKADATFGDHGVAVTKVSKEDDVLYDVDIGASGVAASGFTTDAGTRQVLLITYPVDDTAANVPSSRQQAVEDTADTSSELAPVQEVRVNGKTRVQIRRLQLWGNSLQIRGLELSDSLTGSFSLPRSASVPASGASVSGARSSSGQVRPADDTATERLLTQTGGWIGAFFLPEAQALEGSWSGPAASGGPLAPRVLTTSFSEGESVSYALASDAGGNLVVVGTADGSDGSSIVAARFMVEDMIDRITDQPGHRSSHITTTSTDITRTTITVGGEIAAAFGKDVVRRGVVFSVNPGPLYTGDNLTGAREIWPGPQRGIDALAAFFLPEALAADPAAFRSMPAETGRSASSFPQYVETGKATASGTGTGGFVAVLDRLLPGTVYYIRAYALTAKGEVYYGNQVSVRTADACFIATASFGAFLHPSVGILRDFRDTFLLRHDFGRRLVDWYYTLSPPLADIIAGNEALRFTVRMLLLPCIGFSWLALQTGFGTAVCGVAGAVVLLGWLARGRLERTRRTKRA